MSRFNPGDESVVFERDDIESAARELGIALPKNLGDVVYSFRYRNALPEPIRTTAPPGRAWVIAKKGRSTYAFELRADVRILPDPMLAQTRLPDATPGLVARYTLDDEQALLARLRYNRLVDVFTGVTCYSLQNHLRSTAPGIGQVETDELYVGVDARGAHYVFPAQAKGGRDQLGVVQVEQDVALCAAKFPALACRPIAAQFMNGDVIALFELRIDEAGDVRKVAERHYRLVPPSELTDDELRAYAGRPPV